MLSMQKVAEISRFRDAYQTWLGQADDRTRSWADFRRESSPLERGRFGVSRPQQGSAQPGPLFGPQAGLVTSEAAVPQPVSRTSTRLGAQPGPLFGPQAGLVTAEAAVPQPVSRTSTRLAAQHCPRPQPGPRLGNMSSPRPGHEGTSQPPAFAVHDRPTNNYNHMDEDDEGPWGDALLDAGDYLPPSQPAFAVHDRPTSNYNHMDEDDEGPWGDALLDAGDYLPPAQPATVVRQLPTKNQAVQWKQMMSDDNGGPVLWGTPGFNEMRTVRDPYAPRDADGVLIVAPAPYEGSGGMYPGSNKPTGYPPPLPWH